MFEMAFSLALVAGALLLLGGMVSMGVFLYRSMKGDGMKDPREVAPEKTKDGDSGVTKGDTDDEWDYY
ncbi:hypothetical protein BRC87_02215 [Halobacteriales archaeon QS_4_66_20]|nr:MAG: hypothetical protein BRC87_02215 [Halobacteriales archaeon QS_4_66_20]